MPIYDQEKSVQPALSAIHPGSDETTCPSPASGFLFFQIGQADFGIRVRQVKDIVGIRSTVARPGIAPPVVGVVALCGCTIPVVDHRAKLGLPEIEYTKHTCVVVVELKQDARLIGIVVDHLLEVRSVAEGNWERNSPGNSQQRASHILATTTISGQTRALLDIDQVLTSQELQSLEEILK